MLAACLPLATQVSAASYQARAFGISAGMGIGAAIRLCPQLLVVPYLFHEYEAVSEQAGAGCLGAFELPMMGM